MDLDCGIQDYLSENWEQIVADIDALVRIPSVEDLDAATPGAPFGPEPACALHAALAIAQRMGLDAHDCEGYIGYADLPGESTEQIGIIGHVDVVPAGPDWAVPAYGVTRREGYLLGRGVADDKGPLVVALHAVHFWRQRFEAEGARPHRSVRVLFGANEETGMGDVAYYRAHFADPAFLFTPDAEFPVCYGEAGICSGVLQSAPIADGRMRSLSGGAAVNAVPGRAQAQVACENEAHPQTDDVTIEVDGGCATVSAQGKAAHASTPELGKNAIDVLAAYLLENGLLSAEEKAFMELVRRVTSCADGSGVGVQATDGHFGALSAVGSVISLVRDEDDAIRLRLAIDFRYPTTTSAACIERALNEVAAPIGAAFAIDHDKQPFLMDPSSREVRALIDAYNQVTGEDAHPFTMKGGTYARMFPHAASFGPDKPGTPKPEWAGSMHGPDEAISEGLLKQAFAIYVHALGNLMAVNKQD